VKAPGASRFAELLESCEQPIAKTGMAAALFRKCLLFTTGLSFITGEQLFNALPSRAVLLLALAPDLFSSSKTSTPAIAFPLALGAEG